ncbi:MAG: hypothetical protein AB7H88_06375 [Vicinamibacterales bacterium]
MTDAPPDHPDTAIWNPNAAANWSLIFTPAFGAYLQALNWEALGEPAKARASRAWFEASLGVLALYVVLNVVVSDVDTAVTLGRVIGTTFVIVWYFASGRAQARYVKARFGADYPRRPWGRVLLVAVGALAGYVIFGTVVGVVALLGAGT